MLYRVRMDRLGVYRVGMNWSRYTGLGYLELGVINTIYGWGI